MTTYSMKIESKDTEGLPFSINVEVYGIAVNYYDHENTLNRLYFKHPGCKRLPVYQSDAVPNGSVRFMISKSFFDLDVYDEEE